MIERLEGHLLEMMHRTLAEWSGKAVPNVLLVAASITSRGSVMIRTIDDLPPSSRSEATPLVPAEPVRRCPDCQTPVDRDECPTCGLPVAGTDAEEFWELDAQLVQTLTERTAALQQLRSRRTMAWPPPPTGTPWGQPANTATPGPPTSTPRFPTLSVRDLLLGAGVFSLVVALVSFAVVSWDDLGTAVRLGIIAAIAVIVGRSAVTLFRRDLDATAEAVTAVLLSILVADTAAIADLASDQLDPALTWTALLMGIGLLLSWFTRFTGSRLAPAFVIAAIGAALPISGINTGELYWIAITGLMSLGAVAALTRLAGYRGGRVARSFATVTELANWGLVGVSVVWAVALDDSWRLGLALMAGALTIWVAERFVRTPTSAPVWDALAGGLLIVATGTAGDRLAGAPWGPVSAIAAASVLLTAVLVIAPARRGAAGISLVPIAAGTVALLSLALSAGAELVSFVERPWTGTTYSQYDLALNGSGDKAALVVLGLVLLLAAGTSRCATKFTIGPQAVAAAGLVVYPVLFGVSAWVAATLLGLVGIGLIIEAAIAKPAELRPWRNGFGLVALALASGAALADERLTFVVLAVASLAVWASFVADPRRSAIRVLGIGLIGLPSALAAALAASISGVDSTVGVWIAITLALTSLPLLGDSDAIHQPLDHAGSVVWEISLIPPLLIALTLASSGDTALSIALSIAASTTVLHSTRAERSWLVVLAAAFLAAAALVQIESRGVDLLEVLLLPVALVGAVLGRHLYRRAPARPTMVTWGPGLFAMFGPSTAAAVGSDPGIRPVVLPLLGLVLLWVGIENKNRALVLAGLAIIVAIGLDFLITLTTELPSWIPFATIGILFLGLGADFERSRDRMKGVLHYVHDLN